ncbi:MAG: hypothetical protein IT508_05255 [Burkholderiaceae bacterium]|nr:hypothetical protein [Burkholderiaceae bacterium]
MSTKLSEPVIRGILREAQRAHDHSAAELMRAAGRHLRAAAAIETRLTEKSEQPAEQEAPAE